MRFLEATCWSVSLSAYLVLCFSDMAALLTVITAAVLWIVYGLVAAVRGER